MPESDRFIRCPYGGEPVTLSAKQSNVRIGWCKPCRIQIRIKEGMFAGDSK